MEPGKEKGLKINEPPVAPRPLPPESDPYSVNTTAEIVLDALDPKNLNGETGWDKSIAYLERYLLSKNPNNVKVKEAISYLEGLRVRSSEVERSAGKKVRRRKRGFSISLSPGLRFRKIRIPGPGGPGRLTGVLSGWSSSSRQWRRQTRIGKSPSSTSRTRSARMRMILTAAMHSSSSKGITATTSL